MEQLVQVVLQELEVMLVTPVTRALLVILAPTALPVMQVQVVLVALAAKLVV